MWGEIWRLISSGYLSGLPVWALMGGSLLLGVVLGWLMRKILKFAIILIVGAIIASYLGIFTLTISDLKEAVELYGPQVAHYASIIIGILPLSIGFFIGLFIGFLLA